ncbi:hypothetical protein NC653_016897 [Populus alba x Populus x berolinensis]|uniref:U4/U6.U5 small nuclear ribonucleoprotein 27kDa protein domain-containing protein n=1 Tax=Populus alba x Populus x berolinensis TaxID=444605 RepID=A0AAD6QNX6_9ROSI|nr:hypothetical protein NC653_016897 [Populus alba x Populus x berolinensis]
MDEDEIEMMKQLGIPSIDSTQGKPVPSEDVSRVRAVAKRGRFNQTLPLERNHLYFFHKVWGSD